MAIVIDALKVTLFTVPKCGSTSVKVFAHELASRQAHPGIKPDGNVVGIHKEFPCEAFEAVIRRAPRDYAKVGVLRDPFSRISSCYYGVVIGRPWVLKAQQEPLRARNLSITPSFDAFLEHLETYQQLCPHIAHHSHPLSFFLGRDPSIFARLFDMAQLDQAVAFLRTRSAQPMPPMKRLNYAQQANPDLRPRLRKRIGRLYAEDLDLFGRYFHPPG